MLKKIRNLYYLIAGVLAILFAVTHAWNGQSVVLPVLDLEAITLANRTMFTYVWHIITVENLVFGVAFMVMAFQKEGAKVRFGAWLIVALLLVRLAVILGVTAVLDASALGTTLVDSIAILVYAGIIAWGTRVKDRQPAYATTATGI